MTNGKPWGFCGLVVLTCSPSLPNQNSSRRQRTKKLSSKRPRFPMRSNRPRLVTLPSLKPRRPRSRQRQPLHPRQLAKASCQQVRCQTLTRPTEITMKWCNTIRTLSCGTLGQPTLQKRLWQFLPKLPRGRRNSGQII